MDVAIKDPLPIDIAIERLNSMLEVDRAAVTRLVEMRLPCTDMVDHPTAQVYEDDSGQCWIGHLGLLNGIFGIDAKGWGPIAAVFDQGHLTHFTRTTEAMRRREDEQP